MSEALEKLVHSSATEGMRSRARRHLSRAPVTRGSLGSALGPKSRPPYAREGAGGSRIPLAGPHRAVAGTCRGLHGGRVCTGVLSLHLACVGLPQPRTPVASVRSVDAVASKAPTARAAERWEEGTAQARPTQLTPPPPCPRAHSGRKTNETEAGTETDGWHLGASERVRLSAGTLPGLLVPELISTCILSALKRKEKKEKKPKQLSITKEASINGSKLQTIGILEQRGNLTYI